MIGWFMDLVSTGLATLVAYGGLALAVLAWGVRFHPAVRWPLTEGVILVFGGALFLSAWNLSALHHDRQVEVDRLHAVVAEQARQRELAIRVAKQAQDQARHRAADLADLQETIDDYESALAAGTASACPADPDYASRMLGIRIGPAGKAGAATSRN